MTARRPLTFGANVMPDDPRLALEVARMADDAGLDLVGIQDHPYTQRFLDTWMLMATVLAVTERVTIFPNVSNLPLRPPAMLAKAAATLDVLSGGRFELGIGAGAFRRGIEAMGGPARSPREALEALAEAIEVIRLFWRGERGARFQGRHYSLAGLNPGPPPAHAIGIWVGGYKPRMLALTGRAADGWVISLPYAPPERIPAMQARIDEAAEAAGRRPEDVRRIYNVMGRITDGEEELLVGPVEHWVEELSRFALELGMDTFMFWPREDQLRQLELFVGEVAPAVAHAAVHDRARAG